MRRTIRLALAIAASTALAADGPSTVPLEPDHCIGLVWSQGGFLDLQAMLDPVCAQFGDKLYFTANGNECKNGRLDFDDYCPGSLKPDIYYAELRHRDIDLPLDAMWVVVNSPVSRRKFDEWAAANADTGWTKSLPKPFATIDVAGGRAADPEPPGPDGRPGTWDAPHRIKAGTYLHHDAAWEMRTTIPGESGNQATYDADGRLIRSTIAAGTADRFGPYGASGSAKWSAKHRNEDVWPFIRALQLDGNPARIPGLVGFPTKISRPCLRQGANTEKYLELRPTILP